MIKKIHLTNFRCFEDVSFNTYNSLVIFSGKNATGKSSTLESIFITSTTKSYRENNLDLVIKDNNESAIIDIDAEKSFKVVLSKEGNSFFYNKKQYKRLSDFIGNLKVVMFSPYDLNLINGGKTFKRRFLDLNISLIDKNYLIAYRSYKKLLHERNEYLKEENIDKKLLEVITKSLIKFLTDVYQARINFINELNSYLEKICIDMEIEKISLNYIKTYGEDIYKSFNDKLKYDLITKSTNIGVHRDDLEILVNGKDSKSFASEGQARTAVLALKLALINYIKEKTGIEPVVLLDDVFAALDNTRVVKITNYIKSFKQAFITTTSTLGIPDELLEKSLVIRL